MSTRLLFLASLFGVGLVTRSADAEERFLLAVGNNVGNATDAVLRWAEADAEHFADVVGDLGDVADDRRTVLLGKKLGDLQLALATLKGRVAEARRKGSRTVVLVYYSGHGDEEALHIRGESLPLEDLKVAVNEIPAALSVTILDACHAGALVRGRDKGLGHGPAFDVSYLREIGPDGRVIITSAGGTEVAQESDDFAGSYFTHYLLSGLRGAADANGDGEVTLAEVYRHVYDKTLVTSHGARGAVQHPMLDSDVSGEGDLVLARLSRAPATLILPEALVGDVLVINERDSHVVVELAKPKGKSIRLGLAAGRFSVQVRQGDALLRARVALPWGGSHEIQASELESMPLLEALARGGGMFAAWDVGGGVMVGTSLATVASTAFGAQGFLGIRSHTGWTLRGTLGAAMSSGASRLWTFRNRELVLGVEGGWGFGLGPIGLDIRAGPALVGVWQVGERRNAGQIAMVSTVATTLSTGSVGAGVRAMLDAWVPVISDLAVGVELGGAAWTLKDGGERRARVGYVSAINLRWQQSITQ